MSEPEKDIIRDFESYEEGLYHILIERGKSLLYSYLLKIKWDKIKTVRDELNFYLPLEIYNEFKKYDFDEKKLNLAMQDYQVKLTKKSIDSLDSDFSKINQELVKFNPSYEKTLILLDDYFYDKLKYYLISSIFQVQFNYIINHLKIIFDSLPKEIKNKRIEEKREEERKRKEESRIKKEKEKPNFISYKIDSIEILNDFPNIEKIVFDVLRKLDKYDITIMNLEEYEIKYILNDPKKVDKYLILKKNLEKNLLKRLARLETTVLKRAKKHTKRILKEMNKELIKKIRT